MIELSEICANIALMLFWITLFIEGFAVGSNKWGISKWGFIPLLMGWFFLFIPQPGILGVLRAATLSNWAIVIAFIVPFVVSAWGLGYLLGRLFWRWK